MKKVKDEYFVWHTVKGWIEVKGEPVVIPGFEEYDLFVHGEIDTLGFCDLDSLTASEGKSGSRVSKVGSKEEVIEYAAKLFTDHGKEDVDVRIKESVGKNGLSPRWSMGD